MTEYRDGAALRAAIEARLKRRAEQTGAPLDRLRKEVANGRLLARFAAIAPSGSWVLKGGLALIARIGDEARATKDIDVNWRRTRQDLDDVIESVVDTDLDDFFEFEVERSRELDAESPEGGIRYPVTARLGGREFERLQLDVNLVPDDPRPFEHVLLRNPFAFAGLPAPSVPTVRIEQQLAEKLHAYTRSYRANDNSRAKDLFDMLLVAHSLPVPDAPTMSAAARVTFAIRRTAWPPRLGPPPQKWEAAWAGFVADHDLLWVTLAEAELALRQFWDPVLAEDLIPANWNSQLWKWVV
ncbi:MAG: nucleotidyl transferase AbiEii/AbiGii toxin family protein [Egibacteraceae bacterium]